MSQKKRTHVIVVGSGVSGLVAARAIVKEDADARVTLIEASDKPGGHDTTVRLPSGEPVDMGYMVFNEHSYPNMVNLYKDLGVDTVETDMSFAVTIPGSVSWSFKKGASWALRNLWRPRLWRWVAAHTRFRCKAVRLIQSGTSESYSHFIQGLESTFVNGWLTPFIKAVWSVGDISDIDNFDALPLMRFLSNHGFLQPVWDGLLQWRTPAGRAADEVQAILNECQSTGRFKVMICSPVRSCAVSEAETFVELESGERIDADCVVLAAGPDKQFAMLRDSDAARAALLRRVRTTSWDVVLHQDSSYMPLDKSDWASWNVVGDVLTYWLSQLQHLQDRSVFVSLFPKGEAPIQKIKNVVHSCQMAHPVLSVEACEAREKLLALSVAAGGKLSHAGAWTGTGFHEGAVLSGLCAARLALQSAKIPVFYPMSCTPVEPTPVTVDLVHSVSGPPASKGGSQQFSSKHLIHRFDSRFPPKGALAADHLITDHGHEAGWGLLQDADIRGAFAAETGIWPDGPITVTCALRALSTVPAFNPLTAYFAWNQGMKRPVAAMFEVHNTPWEERAIYAMLLDQEKHKTVYRCDKTMHVSPAHPNPASVKQFYEFSVSSPDDFDIVLFAEDNSPMFTVQWRIDTSAPPHSSMMGSFKAFSEVYGRMLKRLGSGKRVYQNYTARKSTGNELLMAHSEYVLSATLLLYLGHPWLASAHLMMGLCSVGHHHVQRESNVILGSMITTMQAVWRFVMLHSLGGIRFQIAVCLSLIMAFVDAAGQATLSLTLRFQGMMPLMAWAIAQPDRALLAYGLLLHAVIALVLENLKPLRASHSCRRADVSREAQSDAILWRLLMFSVKYMAYASSHWDLVADRAFSPYVYHEATWRCCRLFMAHLMADLWLALTSGVQGRKAFGLKGATIYHHAFFVVAGFLNTTYNVFAPDFVWLIIVELSSNFLALRKMVPSLHDIFGVAFFVTRFSVFLYGCYHLFVRLSIFERPAETPFAVLAFTVLGCIADFVFNIQRFGVFLEKLRGQGATAILRAMLGLAVTRSFEPRIVLQMPGEPEPKRPAVLAVHNTTKLLQALIFRGEVGLGEAFVEGVWSTRRHACEQNDPEDDHSLYHLLLTAARNYVKLSSSVISYASVSVPDMRSADARKKSIVEHYDDTQEIFVSMLDANMVYSAALFLDSADDTLEAAQLRKIDRILDLADVDSTQPPKLLDLGCGWGQLVRRAAQERGAQAVGITNSPSMCKTCNDRSLSKRELYMLGDFLELQYLREEDAFDAITSVETIEAVRYHDYRRFAASVQRSLKARGKAVFQIIHAYSVKNPTIRKKDLKEGGTFVQTYIFPGQQLPYLEHVLDQFAAEGLECVHLESAGLHYARTLRVWRRNLQRAESVRRNGTDKGAWDEKTFRKYQYYLAWCEAGFSEGILELSRVVFQKKNWRKEQ